MKMHLPVLIRNRAVSMAIPTKTLEQGGLCISLRLGRATCHSVGDSHVQTRVYRLVGTGLDVHTRLYRLVGTDLYIQTHVYMLVCSDTNAIAKLQIRRPSKKGRFHYSTYVKTRLFWPTCVGELFAGVCTHLHPFMYKHCFQCSTQYRKPVFHGRHH